MNKTYKFASEWHVSDKNFEYSEFEVDFKSDPLIHQADKT